MNWWPGAIKEPPTCICGRKMILRGTDSGLAFVYYWVCAASHFWNSWKHSDIIGGQGTA